MEKNAEEDIKSIHSNVDTMRNLRSRNISSMRRRNRRRGEEPKVAYIAVAVQQMGRVSDGWSNVCPSTSYTL